MEINEIVEKVIKTNRFFLMEHESKDLISKYGIPVGRYGLVNNKEDALNVAQEIGYPIALKIMSPDIIHKTEAQIVKLDIRTESELLENYEVLIENLRKYNPNAEIEGVNVQQMAENGLAEVIIGGVRDVNFGAVLMFGLGGIFVEIFKDVSYRVCPIKESEAKRMIKNIKAFPILNGYRGKPKADIGAIVECLQNCCTLLSENPRIEELDLNPIIVFEQGKGIMVVDARIILKEDL
ncbi:MAG: acetyl-CoA synthetase [Candidatus Lokiarchaeota archaeon]|nr:acetyl-CoA synthetase [Candidatus Lokiarchaeota archaeon]